jgi:hypothetical protein
MSHTQERKDKIPAVQLQSSPLLVSSSAINVTIEDLIVEGPATSIGFRILDLGREYRA